MAEHPWLSIIGLGEDGLEGLTPASREALDRAEFVFGAPRHLALVQPGARGQPWPVPFDVAPVLALRGRRVAILASGDPFWLGAGGSISAQLRAGEWQAFPVPGVFSLAASKLGWRLEDTVCLGLHAAPFARLRPHLARNCRILVTLRDKDAPARLASWLVGQQMGAMIVHVLERLGGPFARIRRTRADDFALSDIAAPVAVALDGSDLPRQMGIPRGFGLPDQLFSHEGQITKRMIRAATLAALAPRPGEFLWDIGGGSGSISVEWALAGGEVATIEPRADRMAHIQANIDAFGLGTQISPHLGHAPDALAGLPVPDAVFIGGGASPALFDQLTALPQGTRLVANAVTLETEAMLIGLHAEQGGDLIRINLDEAAPLGGLRGWRPARSVTQWAVTL